MAIFRHLKTLVSQSAKNNSKSAISRPFFSLCTQQSVASLSRISVPFLLSRNAHIRRHFLFRSVIHFPVVGPLFLANPPWKLLQSSTPLILRSDAVLNLLKLRALDLLQSPGFKYPLGDHRLWDRGGIEKVRNDLEVGHRLLWESYFNLPNYISFGRLLSGPVIACMIMHEMYSPAFFALAISGASDWLDGYAARKMRIDSVVGSYLDPLADKVLIGCVALAMVEKDLLHPGLVSLVLLRDVGLLGGAVFNRVRSVNWQLNSWRVLFDLNGTHSEKMRPLLISKVNTFFQLILVAAALLQPAFGNEETQLYINTLSFVVAGTTLTSTAAYGLQFMKSRASMGKQMVNSRT